MMFFGFGRYQGDDNIVRLRPIYSTILMVEHFAFLQYWREIYINILGNLFMFLPFGFLGFLFPKLNNLRTLLVYFLSVIIIIEFLQYFTRVGVFDIDDIILNTIGVILGFYLKNLFENYFVKNKT